VFVNNEHDNQRRGQDFDLKSLYLNWYTAKRLTDEFPEKSWTKRGVNKLFKKMRDTGTVNRQPGSGRPRSASTEENAKPVLQKFMQSPTDVVLPIVRWSDREHLSSVKKTKSVADCGNFWSRSLARFMRAAQFASVSSCAWRFLKHFSRESSQIIRNRDDQWILVSRDISWTVLWVCGLFLFSWLRAKSWTVSMFSSVPAQIDRKSK